MQELAPKNGLMTTGSGTVTKNKSWVHFVAGGYNPLRDLLCRSLYLTLTGTLYSTGGMTAAILTSPLDVLKTRLQSDFYQSQLAISRATRSTLPYTRSVYFHLNETCQLLFSIHRIEGWRALFKGLGPNLTGVIPASAIKFYAYGNFKHIISQTLNEGKETAWVHLSAAATAGIVVSTATNPIWLIKTRLQLDKSHTKLDPGMNRQYKSSLDCFIKVLRQEGIKGLYRGLSASYLGVTESTLQWVLYEQMKMYLSAKEESMIVLGKKRTMWDQTGDWVGKIGAAGSAKFVAAAVTYPHEVVRTRLRQAPTESGQQKYTASSGEEQVARRNGLANNGTDTTLQILAIQ
ncbi:MAG: hypothetical protein M1834_006091 [Cirrosporium novae-zelandiae]|nr:MAG: hypothetical protein M1834_006091 [Cirrosporium novae-zelandiae]